MKLHIVWIPAFAGMTDTDDCTQARTLVPYIRQSMIKEFLRGSIRVHILYHASKGPVYGVEMLKELRRHGYHVGPGTLYPMLHNMARGGFLACEKKLVNGRIRKYYVATGRGRRVLEQVRRRIHELMKEVLEIDSDAGGKR